MDLLVWFEPERIRPGLELAVEHPEWMLKLNDPEVENMLLDLTNPDCFQWICETFVKLFNESGISATGRTSTSSPCSTGATMSPTTAKACWKTCMCRRTSASGITC